jgi:transposase
MNATTVAVDLAKSVFQLAVADGDWRVIESHRLTRGQFERWFQNRDVTLVIMEACGSAHHWAPLAQWPGHRGQAAAGQLRPRLREAQQDRCRRCLALLEAARACRDRSRCASSRSSSKPCRRCTVPARCGWERVHRASMPCAASAANSVWRYRRGRVPASRQSAARWPIRQTPIPGMIHRADEFAGGGNPSAGVAHRATGARTGRAGKTKSGLHDPVVDSRRRSPDGHGDGGGDWRPVSHFKDARHFASWFGLTPREFSSGNSRVLGRISKKGDRYLRMLLTHGARAVLRAASVSRRREEPSMACASWGLAVQARANHNKAACAVANKLARICYATLRDGEPYGTPPASHTS